MNWGVRMGQVMGVDGDLLVSYIEGFSFQFSSAAVTSNTDKLLAVVDFPEIDGLCVLLIDGESSVNLITNGDSELIMSRFDDYPGVAMDARWLQSDNDVRSAKRMVDRINVFTYFEPIVTP